MITATTTTTTTTTTTLKTLKLLKWEDWFCENHSLSQAPSYPTFLSKYLLWNCSMYQPFSVILKLFFIFPPLLASTVTFYLCHRNEMQLSSTYRISHPLSSLFSRYQRQCCCKSYRENGPLNTRGLPPSPGAVHIFTSGPLVPLQSWALMDGCHNGPVQPGRGASFHTLTLPVHQLSRNSVN